jgi:hypothetical protein
MTTELQLVVKFVLVFKCHEQPSLHHVLVIPCLHFLLDKLVDRHFDSVAFIFHLDKFAFYVNVFLHKVTSLVRLVLLVHFLVFANLAFDHLVKVLQFDLNLLARFRVQHMFELPLQVGKLTFCQLLFLVCIIDLSLEKCNRLFLGEICVLNLGFLSDSFLYKLFLDETAQVVIGSS